MPHFHRQGLRLAGCFAAFLIACAAPTVAEAQGQRETGPSGQVLPFTPNDELILELEISGADRRDTIIAYGQIPEIYLPLGLISRLLDLAITVTDDGRFASGWVLRETSSVVLEADKNLVTKEGIEVGVPAGSIIAFDGEMYVTPEALEIVLPVEVSVDIRAQSVRVTTLEEFPFQAQKDRENRRNLLNSRGGEKDADTFPRLTTPYKLYDIPRADIELRAVSDGPRGTRAETEIYLAGDLAAASAELFLAAASNDGLTAALFEIGRDDPEGHLLGPLDATSFAVGDVQTSQQPIGLRSSFGRGFRISNVTLNSQSVFDEIDLRGVLQDGYEVELYRNGILLGSTSEAINGQYEFLQVPVDLGLNAFRLVFYGPQGQTREEVRTIRVGDGRLPAGEFNYEFGVVQNERTLLDVRPSGTILPPSAGNWRSVGNVAYGISSALTLVGSASLDEGSRFDQNFVGSLGMRTGFGNAAVRFDTAFASSGGLGAVAGLNSQIGGINVTLNHGEYLSGFIDEQLGPSGRALSRATDLNLSASIGLGTNVYIPLIGRARRIEYADGGHETRASLRASTRVSDFLLSNSFEFSEFANVDGFENSQFIGNFDLATGDGDKFRARAAIDYELVPDIKPIALSLVTDLNLREDTFLQLSTAYRLDGESWSTGASISTNLGKTRLALDADYDLRRDSHSVALRWGLSLGKSQRGFYLEEPARAKQGSVEVTAFHDQNANGKRDADEEGLPNLAFFSSTQNAETDESGVALITGLPANRPTNIQIDLSSLPDISLMPEFPGIQIVPRRGRTHVIDFPIVSIGEVEGTVFFQTSDAMQAVGGVILGLQKNSGNAPPVWLRSEADGYFYFERIRPGSYQIILDEDQATRLNICFASDSAPSITVPAEGGALTTSISLSRCS